MCLAVPGQVREIYEAHGTRMGKMDFGGVVKEVCLAYLPEIQIGDYAIVHVGFAISQVDEHTARETLRLFEELGVLDEELGPGTSPTSAATCSVPRWADPHQKNDPPSAQAP
jgi:hydrogenase expression/formation protein HypC